MERGLLSFYYSNNPTATVNAIVLTNANRLVLFVIRDQALATKLLDIYVAIDNEDSDLTNVNSVALLNKHLVTVYEKKEKWSRTEGTISTSSSP